MNVQKVNALVQNILHLSLVKSGKMELKFQPVEIIGLIQTCIESRLEKPILDAHPITGYWSAPELSRVLDNLLDNAYKYGDRTSPVTIRVAEHHCNALISVHNEGDPIPPDEQENIFLEYYRVPLGGNAGINGWGLGLSIVRNIVQAHGGTVAVDSAPGRGTTFTVQIPVDSRPFVMN